jgi:hypothetical protein
MAAEAKPGDILAQQGAKVSAYTTLSSRTEAFVPSA